jgi:dTMP kinase
MARRVAARMEAPGLFITFEGCDGAGKTTQIALLHDALVRDEVPVFVTREPGGDEIAEAIRELLLMPDMNVRTELLLFLAARAQNVEHAIRPHLATRHVVLCDRFCDSTFAYQGHGRGIAHSILLQLNAFATHGLVPDITFLLDICPEVGLSRVQNKNRMEEEGIEFQRRVREGFLHEAQKEPARIRVLDASLPVDQLHQEIYDCIRQRRGVRDGR